LKAVWDLGFEFPGSKSPGEQVKKDEKRARPSLALRKSRSALKGAGRDSFLSARSEHKQHAPGGVFCPFSPTCFSPPKHQYQPGNACFTLHHASRHAGNYFCDRG